MEGVEEEPRLAIEAGRDRRVARRSPALRRFEQRLSLLAVRPKHMICDRDPDAVGGRPKIVAGIEEEVAPVLARAEGAFDEMPLPVEVVAKHDRGFTYQRAPVVRETLRAHRSRHGINDR